MDQLNKLKSKFKEIDFIDYKLVIEEVSKLDSITKKLDHLRAINEKGYGKFEKIKNSLNKKEFLLFLENEETIRKGFFGNQKPVTSLCIQESVFKHFFQDELRNPELTFWFLKYNAELLIEHLIRHDKIKEKLNSPISKKFIQAELKKINDFEIYADKLLLENEIDIYGQIPPGSDYIYEIEYQRIKSGYYENHPLDSITGGNLATEIYARHNLLKPMLEEYLNSFENHSIDELMDILNKVESELTFKNLSITPSFDKESENLQNPIVYRAESYELREKFNSIFQLIINSDLDTENEYFPFTSLNNYKAKIDDLFKDFVKEYPDSNKSDFFKDQLKGYNNVIPMKLLMLDDKIKAKTKTKIQYSINRKVEYLNSLIRKENSSPDIPKRTVKKSRDLKDLFKIEQNYKIVIDKLENENFISINKDNSLNWMGCLKEPSIKPLRLLGVLGLVLQSKNYLEPNLDDKEIVAAMNKTFNGYGLSDQYYSNIKKDIIYRSPNSKGSDYYNCFHFIPTASL